MVERRATVLVVDAPSDRRSAAVMAYARSPHVGRIFVTSGAGLLSHNCPDLPPDSIRVLPIKHTDREGIVRFAEKIKPDLVTVDQEDAIYAGVTDELRRHGFLTFGVSRTAGRLEWDKAHAREVLRQYGTGEGIPNFRIFDNRGDGLQYIATRLVDERFNGELFLKARYPAAGKGVYMVRNVDEAAEAFLMLNLLPNGAGRSFLVEDGVGGLNGEEFSAYFFGSDLTGFGYYQDHKRVYDKDKGSNTGGMGSIGPISLVTPELDARVKRNMVQPVRHYLASQGVDFRGILYVAGMYDLSNMPQGKSVSHSR